MKKRENNLYSFYDRSGIQQHLAHMASKGWMLEKTGRSIWTYRRIEPKAVQFSVIYFAPASEFDCSPGQQQQAYEDLCAQTGWRLAASWSQMLIFFNEDPAPVPIETDAAVQVDAVHQAMKKNFLPSYALLMALTLYLFGKDLFAFWKDPADTLSNPAALTTPLLWLLTLLHCATALSTYFLWYRKARRAAEETGCFTPIRGHRRLRLLHELLSTGCFLSLFFSLPSSLSLLLFGVLLALVALQGLLAGLRALLRRTGWSTEVNRPVTQVLSFLLAFAVISALTWGGPRLLENPPWARTYEYQGERYDADPIELPLTWADLTGEAFPHVARSQLKTRTYFLSRQICKETIGLPGERLNLQYTITDIRRPWLRDTVVQDLLENRNLTARIPGRITFTLYRSWLPEPEPDRWGADAAYRLYLGEEQDQPDSVFLLFYGDRIVELQLPAEPTERQQTAAGRVFRTIF